LGEWTKEPNGGKVQPIGIMRRREYVVVGFINEGEDVGREKSKEGWGGGEEKRRKEGKWWREGGR